MYAFTVILAVSFAWIALSVRDRPEGLSLRRGFEVVAGTWEGK